MTRYWYIYLVGMGVRVSFMVFNTTFNNISVISWQSQLYCLGGGNQSIRRKPPTYHIMLYQLHLIWAWFKLTNLVVICTDCIGSCKSNYRTITATETPMFIYLFRHECSSGGSCRRRRFAYIRCCCRSVEKMYTCGDSTGVWKSSWFDCRVHGRVRY